MFLDATSVTVRRVASRPGGILLIAAVAGALSLTVFAQRGPTAIAAPPQSSAPRLLVLLVIDQFRADYWDWYGSRWSGGLRRLWTEGAVFPRATMPYAITKTCAGHASIATGAVPAAHGLIDNEWYDSTRRAFVGCTMDVSASPVGFAGKSVAEQHSAAALRLPTLGDELRRQARAAPRIVSVALKARAAISLGGQGGPGTIILWEEDSGHWATSSRFATVPWPVADDFFRTHPSAVARGQLWHRLLPAERYRHEDRGQGEPVFSVFPHALTAPGGVPSAALWDASPWSDAYLADLAVTLTERAGLGSREATDLLAVSFGALDYVGHSYGPKSHEVQDVLVRLDVVLGRLLDALDRTVGRDKYVVALTSDHGVADLPEQTGGAVGGTGGRLSLNAIGSAVETALSLHFGRRPFIETITGAYVHFLPGVLDLIRHDPAASRAVASALLAVRGIDQVYWSWELADRRPTADLRLMSMRNSYVAGRSGDLAFQPRANWVAASVGTNHGSWHGYDREVPVIFFGAGIIPGRHPAAISPLDVAPTLAALAGITMPSAEGVPLTEILRR